MTRSPQPNTAAVRAQRKGVTIAKIIRAALVAHLSPGRRVESNPQLLPLWRVELVWGEGAISGHES